MGQPLIGGTVKPPEDMVEAARLTLGDRFEAFIEEYGEDFTPKQLCDFVEDE